MLKVELQNILNSINNAEFSQFLEYQNTVKLIIEKLNHIKQEDRSPMLDAWLTMGSDEIKKESQRLNDFGKYSPEKQKTEFMYSKSTVSMALTNILMHL
jgi:hypothetical protein